MFELGGVAAFDVAQRRVRVDHFGVDETLQGEQVFTFTETIEPSTAERQRAEVLRDGVVQLLGFRVSRTTGEE